MKDTASEPPRVDFDQHTTVKKRKLKHSRLQSGMTALDQVELSYRRQLEAAELRGLGAASTINRQIEGCWRDEQRKQSLWQVLAASGISKFRSCRWDIGSNYKGMRRAEMKAI